MKDVYFVAGNPVFHSKSPDIYNYLFEKYGINAVYMPVELDKDNFEMFADNFMEALNIKGMNVTMPLKEKAADWADTLDNASLVLKSVNTVKDKKGYTTDGRGFLLSLKYQGIDVKNKNVVLMGAGGAARSICYELAKSGARISILNRTLDRAKAMADTTGGNVEYGELSYIHSYMGDCSLLINCTSLGMKGADFKDLSFLSDMPKHSFVYDIVYEPAETALLKEARALGITCSNGLDMLICQALYAFEIFTGIAPSKRDRDELLKML